MVGAGKAEGAIDAGNMLKPALARGELHCVGATTLDEYRKYIEKDAALERRFQKVLVDEPTRRGDDRHPARPAGEVRAAPRRRHHRPGDRRRGGAVAPLHHRPFPAGQGDRPDRRGRRAHQDGDRLQAGGDGQARPPHDPAQDRARGGEEGEGRGLAEAAGADRGRDRASSQREYADLEEIWKAEKAQVQGSAHIKEEIERVRAEIAKLQREGKLDKVAELQYGKLPQLEAQLKAGREGGRRPGAAEAPAHPGRRGGDRRGRVARDRHPGRRR